MRSILSIEHSLKRYGVHLLSGVDDAALEVLDDFIAEIKKAAPVHYAMARAAWMTPVKAPTP